MSCIYTYGTVRSVNGAFSIHGHQKRIVRKRKKDDDERVFGSEWSRQEKEERKKHRQFVVVNGHNCIAMCECWSRNQRARLQWCHTASYIKPHSHCVRHRTSTLGLDRYRYRVSADTRQYWSVSVSADTYLSSPVVHLPVSTVNIVATHTYSFKPIPYFHAYIPHTYNLYTPMPRTKSHFQYK